MDRVEMGKRVRAARAYGGWTRAEDLARKVGIGRTTLLKIEKGDREPKYWELVAIAKLCGLPETFFTADWGRGSPAGSNEVDPAGAEEVREKIALAP